MRVYGITREAMESAAKSIGVTVDVAPAARNGTSWRVKVNPDPSTEEVTERGPRGGVRERSTRYQRISASTSQHERRVSAVCWHGFRDFFRACFALAPAARFITAFDTWNGSADFEARYRESGRRNIGSAYSPMYAAEACRCPESGRIN